MPACRDCEREFWHCHGTLIRHPDGSLDCTDDCTDDSTDDSTHDGTVGCPGVEAPHAFRIPCAEVAPSCCAPTARAAARAWPRGA